MPGDLGRGDKELIAELVIIAALSLVAAMVAQRYLEAALLESAASLDATTLHARLASLSRWSLCGLLAVYALIGMACAAWMRRNVQERKRHLRELDEARRGPPGPLPQRLATAADLRFSAEEKVKRAADLIDGFTHEIGNPLATLSMNLDALEESLHRSPCADFDARISDMRDALDRVGAFLHGLTALSTQNRNRDGRVDINEILRGLAGLVRLSERTRNADLALNLSPDTVSLPLARGPLLFSLFTIFDAATKRIHDVGGSIEVATRMSAQADELLVRLACSSLAPSSPPRDARADVLLESEHPGLDTVRRIIESMDGAMKVSTKTSGDMVFELSFPSVDSGPASAASG